MADLPWKSIAIFLASVIALPLLLKVWLRALSIRARRNPGVGSRVGAQPPPKIIELGYIPAGPETSYAPARWAWDPSTVREGRLTSLRRHLDRLQAIREQVLCVSQASARDTTKFEIDRSFILRQLGDYCTELQQLIANFDSEEDPGKRLVRAYRIREWAESAFANFCKAYVPRGSRSGDTIAQQPLADPVQQVASAAEIEKRFTLIFAMHSPVDRERIIAGVIRRRGSDRVGAMKFAVDDWEKDNR